MYSSINDEALEYLVDPYQLEKSQIKIQQRLDQIFTPSIITCFILFLILFVTASILAGTDAVDKMSTSVLTSLLYAFTFICCICSFICCGFYLYLSFKYNPNQSDIENNTDNIDNTDNTSIDP